MLKRENLRPFLKPPTGIGRGRGGRKSGGLVKMSPEDQSKIERAEHSIESLNRSIPSFIRDDMTSEEIQEAIISEIRRTGEPNMQVQILPIEIDGRFSAPKDKYFALIIDGLNATHYTSGGEEFFISRAEKIEKNYNTKDLRRFVVDELGEKVYRGGRSEYITTIGLALLHRFNPWGSTGRGLRENLTTLTSRAIDRIKTLENRVSARKDNRRYIAEIQAKYKGGKK